ncbi:ribosome maturation factor RimM [Hoeflea poritis]|uniref:Ribosome maturation factor RimM n=1 Tax=Hoeflea poritis TaxID=2993659 RepID=A0ABT4VLS8_9HYPH|nr:ribosome maturation factor RimM [Hoeflea poritis]MDA4845559.1 ribosome maturation factor RimM [Hoeflea poritis]
MAQTDDLIVMAEIGAPHGVRGELRARAFTADPLAIGDYGSLVDANGRVFTVLSVRPTKNVVILRLEGVGSREAAEALKGLQLHIPRSRLEDGTLDDEEFFQSDLVGLAVRDAGGTDYGTVIAMHNFGAGDILEIRLSKGRASMIPFSEAAVPDIDFETGVLTVDPLAAGLDDPQESQGPGSRRRRPANKAAGKTGGERQ